MEINASSLTRNIKNSNPLNKQSSKINAKRYSKDSKIQKHNILNNIHRNNNNKHENKKIFQPEIESLITDTNINFKKSEKIPHLPISTTSNAVISRNIVQNKVLFTNIAKNNYLSTSSTNSIICHKNDNNNNDAISVRNNISNSSRYYNLKRIFKNSKTSNNSKNNSKNNIINKGSKGKIYTQNNSINNKYNKYNIDNNDHIFKVGYKSKIVSGENTLIEGKIKNMKNNKNHYNVKKLQLANIHDNCFTEREMIEDNSNNYNHVISIPVLNNELQCHTDRNNYNNYNNFNKSNRVFSNVNNINNNYIINNVVNNIKINDSKKFMSRNKSIKLIPFAQSKNTVSYQILNNNLSNLNEDYSTLIKNINNSITKKSIDNLKNKKRIPSNKFIKNQLFPTTNNNICEKTNNNILNNKNDFNCNEVLRRESNSKAKIIKNKIKNFNKAIDTVSLKLTRNIRNLKNNNTICDKNDNIVSGDKRNLLKFNYINLSNENIDISNNNSRKNNNQYLIRKNYNSLENKKYNGLSKKILETKKNIKKLKNDVRHNLLVDKNLNYPKKNMLDEVNNNTNSYNNSLNKGSIENNNRSTKVIEILTQRANSYNVTRNNILKVKNISRKKLKLSNLNSIKNNNSVPDINTNVSSTNKTNNSNISNNHKVEDNIIKTNDNNNNNIDNKIDNNIDNNIDSKNDNNIDSKNDKITLSSNKKIIPAQNTINSNENNLPNNTDSSKNNSKTYSKQKSISYNSFKNKSSNTKFPSKKSSKINNSLVSYKEELIQDNKIEKNNDKEKILLDEFLDEIFFTLLKEEEISIKNEEIDPKYILQKGYEITPEMRTMVIDWLIEIHQIFRFKEKSLFTAVQLIDKYLSKCQITTDEFQILVLTALNISSKEDEIEYPILDNFITVSGNNVTKDQMIKMENKVLSILNYSIITPSMLDFFEIFAKVIELSPVEICQGLYVLNILLLDVNTLKYKNSVLAFAVLKLITKKNIDVLFNFCNDVINEINMKNGIKEGKEKKNVVNKFLERINNEEKMGKITDNIKTLFRTVLTTHYHNAEYKFNKEKFHSIASYTVL